MYEYILSSSTSKHSITVIFQ